MTVQTPAAAAAELGAARLERIRGAGQDHRNLTYLATEPRSDAGSSLLHANERCPEVTGQTHLLWQVDVPWSLDDSAALCPSCCHQLPPGPHGYLESERAHRVVPELIARASDTPDWDVATRLRCTVVKMRLGPGRPGAETLLQSAQQAERRLWSTLDDPFTDPAALQQRLFARGGVVSSTPTPYLTQRVWTRIDAPLVFTDAFLATATHAAPDPESAETLFTQLTALAPNLAAWRPTVVPLPRIAVLLLSSYGVGADTELGPNQAPVPALACDDAEVIESANTLLNDFVTRSSAAAIEAARGICVHAAA